MTDATRYSKVGRNETCPCGSGKKYKKCHGSEGIRAPDTPQQLATDIWNHLDHSAAGPGECSFAFEPDECPIEICGAKFFQTSGFRQLRQQYGITAELFEERVTRVHAILERADRLQKPMPNFIVDASDSNAGSLIAEQGEYVRALRRGGAAPPLGITHFVREFSLGDDVRYQCVIEFIPYVMSLAVGVTSLSLRTDLVLHTIAHEFSHAFGINPVAYGHEIGELEVMADVVAFVAGQNGSEPPEYFRFFSYLQPRFSANNIDNNIAARRSIEPMIIELNAGEAHKRVEGEVR